MNKGIYVLIFIVALISPIASLVKKIEFSQDCSGYLKQAADANTVELAYERINMALKYIEGHGLTTGYTSILWRTEDENINYWYRNIKACQSELHECIETNATSLEKSNVLMKVREALTDQGEKGTELTVPPGIHLYPHNAEWGFFNLISSILIIFAFFKYKSAY